MFMKLLIISPAPASSVHDNATSNMTSSRLTRPIRRLDAPRVPSFRTSLMSGRDERAAGIAPASSAVATMTQIVNSSTCGCSRMSTKKGS